MKTLQDHLCLVRENFQINPKQSFEDAQLFFGKNENEKLIRAIEQGYLAGLVPRVYIFGQYGTGKTHLLYNLKHHFENDPNEFGIVPLVVQVEAESKTRFQALHKRMLDAVGSEAVEQAYQEYGFGGGDREARFRELFPNANLRQAMQALLAGPALQGLAWRWLTGEPFSAAEQSQLGVTTGLKETGDLVEVLIALGELFKRTGKRLLFLVDEGEGLHNVTNADSQRSWHDAFRRLADSNDNQSVGWIITFYLTLNDLPPLFMTEGDITTRLGQTGQVELPVLAPVEVEEFLRDLLGAFVDHECAKAKLSEVGVDDPDDVALFPFTKDGMEAFVETAASVPGNAIPRTILRALTSCALESLASDEQLFTATLVNDVAPSEFSEIG